jgi:long-chain acyl-CoA synthetase
MREYTQAGEVEVAPADNVVAALRTRVAADPRAAALAVRRGDEFVDISVSDAADRIWDLAAGLIGMGIEPGDRVAIFSSTRVEFTLLDYAIWAVGAATVTIYETSSGDQVQWILGDSGTRAIFCENDDLRRVFESVAASVPECRHVFVIEGGGLEPLLEMGKGTSPVTVAARADAIKHDDVASLVYTSGTTGRPKGCVLTHGNLIWEVRQAVSSAPQVFTDQGSTLMFLPLAHVLARVVQVGCVTQGVRIGYSTGIPKLVEELSLFRPTWVFAVPRVFEKIHDTAKQHAGGGVGGRVFHHAVETAVAWSRAQAAGPVPRLLNARHQLFERLVYRKLRAAFGGRVQYAISGGAPLGEHLGHFLRGAGLLVLEGYGLTETTAAATLNLPAAYRIGSVGRPIPGTSVRIDTDGEIMLRGGNVFRGYWNNDEATAEVLDADGWFRTGDLGHLDEDGFLTITGRKKDIIVTAAGKNVAPAVLEDHVRSHGLISHVMVVGDSRPFIAALVTLDAEALARWADDRDKQTSEPAELLAELARDPDVEREVQSAIDRANTHVSRAESIRAFRILPRDFTISTGEMTPTLKLKRAVVLERYSEVVTEIYGA